MTTNPLFMRLLPVAVLLAALAGESRGADVQTGPDQVGEATMVIGVAKVISTDGVVRVVDRGTSIRVGDRIETAAGGHVHLRFVDGGRLSLRPSSRLQVEDYSHSSAQPAITAIKFRLDEGVVRSITGAWGEAARDRFRLNTPVAAIGVKGTDFVVKSDANNTLASVYTGAIMLTPLANGCQASLGPCLSGNEKLLSEDMKGQMLSLHRLQASPQLVPAVDLLAQRGRPELGEVNVRSDNALKTDGNRSDSGAEKAVVSESRAMEVVASQTISAAPLAPPGPPVSLVPPAPRLPEVNQLVWARLAAVAADGDTITRSFTEAMQNGRQGTVGNFAYSLFRDVSNTGPALLASADTSANFRLAGAAAQLVWSDRGTDVSQTVRVNNGTLNVDFVRATYATELNVSSARMGAESVAAYGVIKPNGVLLSQGGNAFTAGALSLDGKEAGYFFEKSLATGQLRGITQWGR